MTPHDLTSVAACKAWLGLTSTTDDPILADLVTGVSRAILADVGRPALLPATYTEYFDGGWTILELRCWPVTQVIDCSVDGAAMDSSPGSGQAGYWLEPVDTAPPGRPQRLLSVGRTFRRGMQNVAVTYRAGYEILGETARVPASAPFSVAANAPFGPWAIETGVVGAAWPYSVSGGVYSFDPRDAGAAVMLSYGYVPADLARAACEWVADRYMSRSRIGQSAKTLGGQETTSFIVKAMPEVVDWFLQPYRRVV